MSLEAVAAFGMLAFVLVSAIASGAFFMGGHSRDLRALKERQDKAEEANKARDDDVSELRISMGAIQVLSTQLAAVVADVKEIGHDVKNLLTGKTLPARRPRGED